jgi:KaiC/GvpD/RAD55 family RecA-like ATPase
MSHDGIAAPSLLPVIRAASGITPRELEPLWPGVLWIGKPTLLVGDPGLGKSLVTCDLAARVSRGAPWPCSRASRVPSNVLMISGEDDADDTIVPRLIAAGADLDRIIFLDGVRDPGLNGSARTEPLSLDEHMEVLRQITDIQHQRVALLIIDPLSAFMGRTDSHNNTEVRAVLAELGRLAADKRFAVLVVSHFNKMTGANAAYRVTGSLAFVAAARAVFAIARDPQNQDQRLIVPVKSNLGPDTTGFSYTVSVADNDAPCVKWGDERVTRTAEEVLQAAPTSREQAVIERTHDVREWLKAELAEPRQAKVMWEIASRKGFSRRDVERAKQALGILARPTGFKGGWVWALPKGEE